MGTIKEIRQQAGMSQSQFAAFLEIPPRTLQQWEQGKRECKNYIFQLIIYKLENEGKITTHIASRTDAEKREKYE